MLAEFLHRPRTREHDSQLAFFYVKGERCEGENLAQVAFPMGGMGAGMICLEGTDALSKFSLRHKPDLDPERQVLAARISWPSGSARPRGRPTCGWRLSLCALCAHAWSDKDDHGALGLVRA
jgi:hypothetical protein